MSEKIAVITMMRKGSKRFPNKMMVPLMGRPLYMWTVEAALMLGYPYYLFHDYEDLKLPPFINSVDRKPEFSGDIHKTCEEIKDSGVDADIYIFMQATSPIRDVDYIRAWINWFEKHKDYLCGVACHKSTDGYYYNEISEPLNFSTDDRTDNGCEKKMVFKETGSFYIFRKEQLEKKHILDCNSDRRIIFYDPYCIDIDTAKTLISIEDKLKEVRS